MRILVCASARFARYERLAERTSVRLAIFAVLALVLVWPLLPSAGWLNEYRDAQIMQLHEHAAVLSVRRFAELPLWNPWYCGGIYGLGTPQSRFATPLFFLDVLFGPERAESLIVFLFAIAGMEGTYRWLSLRAGDASAALRVAPIFALSGHFAVAYYRGWINFFGFELVPFILYGIALAARGRTAGVVIAAIAFATMLGFGGTFAAPLVAVAGTIEAIRSFFEQPRHRRGRAFAMLVITVSFITTLAAVRLLPIAETLAAAPRLMAGQPGNAPLAIFGELFRGLDLKDGDFDGPGTFYVGFGFLLVMTLGGADRRAWAALVCVVLLTWLGAGYARRPALFGLLRELPVFSGLRYPERFLWIAILFASEPATHALRRVPRLGEGRKWRIGANVVLTLALAISIVTQITQFVQVGSARPVGALVESSREFRQARGNRWLAAHVTALNVGSLSCWETHPVTMSPKLRADLPAEEYLAGEGTARRVSWSPNAIVVHVVLPRAGRLEINQNWHPGWRASSGEVVSDDGLLAVDLPAGERDVTISFRPRSALAGAVVSLTAFAALALLVIGRRRLLPLHRGTTLGTIGLVLAPWVVFGAFALTWSEPRFPPPPQNNADGSPALVSSVPLDAKRTDAKFDVPFALDAVRLAPPDAHANVIIDLYLQRIGQLSRTNELFIEATRRGPAAGAPLRDSFLVIHQVVGGSFYLSEAPLVTLVHDVVGLNVDRAAPGTWDVWLGVGQALNHEERAFVTQANVPFHDSVVQLGTFVVP